MATYVYRNGRLVDKVTGEPANNPNEPFVPSLPYVVSDIKAYRSIASNQMIDSRSARREDLKRTGCREVDPSEAPPRYCHSKKWARVLKMDYVPPPKPKPRVTSVGPIKVD